MGEIFECSWWYGGGEIGYRLSGHVVPTQTGEVTGSVFEEEGIEFMRIAFLGYHVVKKAGEVWAERKGGDEVRHMDARQDEYMKVMGDDLPLWIGQRRQEGGQSEKFVVVSDVDISIDDMLQPESFRTHIHLTKKHTMLTTVCIQKTERPVS
jgi:hypothetical protein